MSVWELFRWPNPPRHECQGYPTAPGLPGFSPINRTQLYSPATSSPDEHRYARLTQSFQMFSEQVIYQISPIVTNEELNRLFAAAWPNYVPRNFGPVLSHSLAYICARYGEHLIGFINLAWDGGRHGFVLDTTVHPDFQRRGIGRQLVKGVVSVARENNIEWLHVDYEPHLHHFYEQCGFAPTQAGVFNLRRGRDE